MAFAQLYAQTFTPVENSSFVNFGIKNFGLTVNGSFKNIKGTISFNPANLKASAFNITVDAATVNTDNSSRDSHLKKEEYFDVTRYPKISFSSDKIDKTTTGTYIVTGRFIIKGITKTVAIPFTATPQNNGYLFSGKIQLNRRDYKVGSSSMILSDNLLLSLNVFAK